MVFLAALLTTAEPSHAGSRLVVEDAVSRTSLREFPVEKGDEFYYRYNHSVYRVWVYHKYKVGDDHRLILLSVLSDPVVLFSPYPGYLLPYDQGIPQPSGLLKVSIMQDFKELIIAVGDELTDKSLMIRQQRLLLRQIDKSLKAVRISVK